MISYQCLHMTVACSLTRVWKYAQGRSQDLSKRSGIVSALAKTLKNYRTRTIRPVESRIYMSYELPGTRLGIVFAGSKPKKVQKNVYLLWHERTICRFLRNPFVKPQNGTYTTVKGLKWERNWSFWRLICCRLFSAWTILLPVCWRATGL